MSLLLILLLDLGPELSAWSPEREEKWVCLRLREVLDSFQYLLLFAVHSVEVKGVNFDCLVHGVPHFDARHCASAIGQDWSQLHCLGEQVHLVVYALAFGVQNELLCVVFAPESEFLNKRLV